MICRCCNSSSMFSWVKRRCIGPAVASFLVLRVQDTAPPPFRPSAVPMSLTAPVPVWFTPHNIPPGWASGVLCTTANESQSLFKGTVDSMRFDPTKPEVWQDLALASWSDLQNPNQRLTKAMAWLQSGTLRTTTASPSTSPGSPPRRKKAPVRRSVQETFSSAPMPPTASHGKSAQERPWRRPGAASRRHRAWQIPSTATTPAPASKKVPQSTSKTANSQVPPLSSPTSNLYREQEAAFVRREKRDRNRVFYRKNDGAVLSSIQTAQKPGGGKGLPALVWSTSRKAHNRRMHALNGNTAVAYVPVCQDLTTQSENECRPRSVNALTIPVNPPLGPAHLTSDVPEFVDVPSDGSCLYHCMVACRDLGEWLATHNTRGHAHEDVRAQRDIVEAAAIRERLVAALHSKGDDDAAKRLMEDGPGGYPGTDTLEIMADTLGFSIVLQEEGGVQVSYGSSGLGAHVLHMMSEDGAGHRSPHFVVCQSWIPRDGGPVPPSSRLALEESMSGMADVNMDALSHRLAIPGASTSAADFNRLFDELELLASEAVDCLVADPAPEKSSVLSDTHRIVDHIRTSRPQWPAKLQHLALGVIALSRWRIHDLALPEHVQLLYMALGVDEDVLRSHDGALWFWADVMQVWAMYEGLFPYAIMQRLRNYLVMVEGLLRSLEGQIQRTPEAILEAVGHFFSKHRADPDRMFLHLTDMALLYLGGVPNTKSRENARAGHRPQDAPIDDSEGALERAVNVTGAEQDAYANLSWNMYFARKMGGLCKRLEDQLAGKQLLQYYCEWCATPRPAMRGVAYENLAFEFDASDGSSMRRLSVPERRNLYFSIPHPLAILRLPDPALNEATSRVRRFYMQTYWANQDAQPVCMAALALAKRGVNVDTVFLYWGPGGVGLSLTTTHLSAMLGSNNHKLFDPQVFYIDEELRKQVELLVGAVVYTAQERPEGVNRGFREDLFKKWASADGIFGRLPYQIQTRATQGCRGGRGGGGQRRPSVGARPPHVLSLATQTASGSSYFS